VARRESGPRSKARKTRRRDRSTNERVSVSPVMLAGFLCQLVLFVMTGLAMVNGSHEMRLLYQNLDTMQRQQDRLMSEYSRLLLERSTLANLQTIEAVARNELGMLFPEDIAEVVP